MQHRKEWMDFEEARAYIRSLKLKNLDEWRKYYPTEEKPKNIPSDPPRTYRDEWKDWNDWLGTDNRQYNKGEWLPFEEAKAYVQSLRLRNIKEWKKYAKSKQKPKNIPSCPYVTYKEEWTDWNNWLGTNNKQHNKVEWLPFEEARTYAQSLGLKNAKEWEKYCTSVKKPNNIPYDPPNAYKDEWRGWSDWLGKITYNRRNRMSFEDARSYVQSLRLTDSKGWWEYCVSGDKPYNIPTRPDRSYQKEWTNWSDWIGTDNKGYYRR